MIKESSVTWRVEEASSRYVEDIRDLFRKVFEQEMSVAHWQWKYGDGRGLGVVVLEKDNLVAFFGGTERRVIFNDEPLVAMQCGDSMVTPDRRGILTRKGPFYLSVTAFLGKYVGEGLPYLLSYGFPNARAMKLAERLKLYEEVGTLLELEWPPAVDSSFTSEALDVAGGPHQELVNELWQRMRACFGGRSIGVRDFSYIQHRYLDNPTLQYEFNLVSGQDSSEPIGLVVTRSTEEGLLLVDVVAEPINIAHLVNFARYRAGQLGCVKLYGWLTEVDFALLEGTAAQVKGTPLKLPLGVYSPGLRADDVRDKWFFMCGDSDFL